MTMRAARFHGPKDIRIEEIDSPTASPGEVLIDVAWCGICGTDLHEYLDGPIFIPPQGHPHPISGEAAPVTMGHEMSGTVSALGGGVAGVVISAPGARSPAWPPCDAPTSRRLPAPPQAST